MSWRYTRKPAVTHLDEWVPCFLHLFFLSLRCFIFPTFPTFLMTIRIADRDFLTFESFGARAMIFFFLGSQKISCQNNIRKQKNRKEKESESEGEIKKNSSQKGSSSLTFRIQKVYTIVRESFSHPPFSLGLGFLWSRISFVIGKGQTNPHLSLSPITFEILLYVLLCSPSSHFLFVIRSPFLSIRRPCAIMNSPLKPKCLCVTRLRLYTSKKLADFVLTTR